MQNMKLYDLQEGKYLELGEDWLYGGEFIIVNICKIGYSIYEAIQHKDSEKFFMYDEDCPFTDEPQEPLKTICKNTGAVVYGGRYVLFENKECGNIYCEKNKWGTVYYLNKDIYSFIPCPEFNLENDKKQTVARFFSLDNCQDNVIGNIFEEYSKQLRNEPNKFKELIKLVK